MIGKIVKGTSFSGCVNYVLKEDKSRLLKAVGVYGSPEEIAEQFELQRSEEHTSELQSQHLISYAVFCGETQ